MSDKIAYSVNRSSAAEIAFHLLRADIADGAAMRAAFATHQPDAVMHLAAETHVDRSIDGPGPFIQSNVVGTYTLLDAAREYWAGLPPDRKAAFRFHHVSTDEVFGALGPNDPPFTENTPTIHAARIRRARRRLIIWCAPGITPTVCRPSSATPPTTTDFGSSPRS